MAIDNELDKFPTNPDDNQSFIDNDGNSWTYDNQTESWEFDGPRLNVNLANENNAGLLSPEHKLLLDTIAQFPGAFGIIVDKPYKQIIQGEVTLTSSTLDISCLNSRGSAYNNTNKCGTEVIATACIDGSTNSIIPRFEISLNEAYLANLCIDLPAPTGQTGLTGHAGITGVDGFSDGPRGKTGSPGPNITEMLELGKIIYEDRPQISNNAIVDINLVDLQQGPSLNVLTSNRSVAVGEKARRLVITPITRAVVYANKINDAKCDLKGLSGWQISKTGGDSLPTIPFLLRGADSESNTQTASPVTAVSLEQYVTSVVELYEKKIVALDKKWSQMAKQHIEAIDNKARSILSALAGELTRCESTLAGTEFGITFERCASSPVSSAMAARSTGDKIGNMTASGKQWDIIS